MEISALIMRGVSLATVWGGLAAAIAHPRQHPDPS